MIKIGIVGGTGYTGVELLRLLIMHPQAEIAVITSRQEAGRAVADIFPNLRGHLDLSFSEPNTEALASCDVVFFATPHGVAQASVPELLDRNVKVIDLSADFRIRSVPVWEQWYGQTHACPERIGDAVYGLPEVNREHIRKAQLIACPGCYPTSVLLGFLPLLERGLIDPGDLVADAASGVSGAGRQASIPNLLAESSDNFKAYGVAGHRHLPEIEQGLADIAGAAVSLTFVPHLLPIIRGIHSTLYANLIDVDADVDVQAVFEERYQDEPFVDVLPPGEHPQTRSVRGSNMVRIAVARPQGRNKVVVMVAEDNLVKGASGQAVQNMNIVMGLPEALGLDAPALLP
ncbi:MAG: N-acetyl-gamma-glutamyl-phosphate reductase [Porticoccaceae bacterium]